MAPSSDPAPKQSVREQISMYTELLKAMLARPQKPKDPHAPIKDERPFAERHPRLHRFLWQGGKFKSAFWTIASTFSLIVNVILIVVVIVLVNYLFVLKDIVGNGLIGGLHENFVKMDEAHIITDIQVDTTIPVVFDLPLSQGTSVILTEDTPIDGATIYLNNAPVPLDITLPKGTALSINLDLIVPVDTEIPVSIPVHVDIPLNQTELHEPFVGLQEVVSPYNDMLKPLPDTWKEAPFCGRFTGWMCDAIFAEQE
ncbi:MAG: hypothetical protein ACOYYS_08335 [Chloroflexota bacterium]